MSAFWASAGVDNAATVASDRNILFIRSLVSLSGPQQRTRMTSERVMMNVLSVLKSRTSTAGFSGVIIVESRSTGVEMSTNGNAGCMIDSTARVLIAESFTSSA